MRFKFALLIAATLFTASVAVRAQEHEPRPRTNAVKGTPVRLGDKVIVVPEPEGFEEATSQFESFKQRIIATEAPQNEVLLAHLPAAESELLRRGLIPAYAHYTKVSVLKEAKELSISRAEMTAAVEDFRKNIGAYLDPNGPAMKQLEQHLERGLTNLDSKATSVDFNKPQQLGEFNAQPDVNSFLMLISFKVNSGGIEQSVPVLTTTTFVRVKDRVVFVYTFIKYRSQADIDTIKDFTTKWTTRIVAANQ